jgi:hypothetical protein
MHHYTNRAGFNGIHAHATWPFKANQPRQQRHPFGAYFTMLGPDTPNLCKKLFIPNEKREFCFSFNPPTPLRPLEEKRGVVHQIYYSPVDYYVPREHQIFPAPPAHPVPGPGGDE